MIVNITVAIVIGTVGALAGMSQGAVASMALVGAFVIGPFINFLIKGGQ